MSNTYVLMEDRSGTRVIFNSQGLLAKSIILKHKYKYELTRFEYLGMDVTDLVFDMKYLGKFKRNNIKNPYIHFSEYYKSKRKIIK